MDEQTIIAEAAAYFTRSRPLDIVAAYLFGSVARGTSRRDSDVDVGLLYALPPPATLTGLPAAMQSDLEAIFKRPVQVVVLNRASADLIHRVMRDGKLIYETDRSARIRFETRSRQIFLDLLPVRREYRRSRQSTGKSP